MNLFYFFFILIQLLSLYDKQLTFITKTNCVLKSQTFSCISLFKTFFIYVYFSWQFVFGILFEGRIIYIASYKLLKSSFQRANLLLSYF